MKKVLIFFLLVCSFIVSAQDRSVVISTGETFKDLTLDASDTINESEYYEIQITALQHYPTMQDIRIQLVNVSGTSHVNVAVYGKLTLTSDSTIIGTAVNWGGTADSAFTISSTSPNRYRYYYIQFTATATDQQSKVIDVVFKQWFSGGSLSGATITDGTATLTGGALSGVTTLTLENGLTIDNAANGVLEFNEASDEFKWTFGSNTITASSTDVTLFDYGTVNLATDALDLSEGDIGNVGLIAADSLKADNTKLSIASGVTSGNVVELQVFETDDNGYTNALSATAGTAPAVVLGSTDGTVAINSNDWIIGTTGIVTGLGDVTSDGKILTTDTVTAATIQATAQVIGAGFNFATAAQVTGSADSISITNIALPTLAAGVQVIFVAEADNTGAATLTYNGTEKNIYEASDISALEANDIRNTSIVVLIYDGTQWQQISQSGN